MAHEKIGDGHGLIKQASGIAAQIQNDSGQPRAHVADGADNGLSNRTHRTLIEYRQLDFKYASALLRRYASRDNMVADDVMVLRGGGIGALNGDAYSIADISAQQFKDLLKGQAADCLAIDLGNQVVCFQAGCGRRSVVQDAVNDDFAIRDLDRNADAAKSVPRGSAATCVVRRQI
jgi:hypothetical protein